MVGHRAHRALGPPGLRRWRGSAAAPWRAIVLLCGALAASPAWAQSARNVLLVVNAAAPDSIRVGEYYAAKRGLDPAHVLRLDLGTAGTMSRHDFERTLQGPLGDRIAALQAHDRILFIVLARGVPLRIVGSDGRTGTAASVDSELALLYRRMTGRPSALPGASPNPYYLASGDLDEARPFSHRDHDVYLVTRLDGFTADEVERLIDRSVAAEDPGPVPATVVVDLADAGHDPRERWLTSVAEAVGGRAPVRVRATAADRAHAPDRVVAYVGWEPPYRAASRRVPLNFEPGAIAVRLVSSDARTFEEPSPDWTPGSWLQPWTFFGGSPEVLLGDLIRDGVTGAGGNVREPLLYSTIRPHILVGAYVRGFTLAEAFYLSLPSLSWQSVVVGDPLTRRFPRVATPPSEIESPVDAETGLPSYFSARRLDALWSAQPHLDRAALRLGLQAAVLRERGDAAGARLALERATGREPRFVEAHLLLAGDDERAGNREAALDRYALAVAAEPDHVVALNNLAFGLAVWEDRKDEALGHARRAYTLSSGAPMVADTLGWIHYLMGHLDEAERYLQEAVRGAPPIPESYVHLATVYERTGRLAEAGRLLREALELDGRLAERSDVLALQARLARPD